MRNKLYGIFGGTFDPVHNGHLQSVTTVYNHCALERICFVPTAVPPHRGRPGASAQQRLEMVALAVANHPQFDVDDRETRRDAPSYTYDTVKSFQAEDAAKCYCVILGVDALLGLESWYRWRELLASVHFLVMRRGGWNPPDPLPGWWKARYTESIEDLKRFKSGKIFQVNIIPNPVSATEIRCGLARGIDVSPMMPQSVWNYIDTNNLYLHFRQEKFLPCDRAN